MLSAPVSVVNVRDAVHLFPILSLNRTLRFGEAFSDGLLQANVSKHHMRQHTANWHKLIPQHQHATTPWLGTSARRLHIDARPNMSQPS